MKRLTVVSVLALCMSVVFSVSSGAAATWWTIAHSRTSGSSDAAGRMLSNSPLAPKIHPTSEADAERALGGSRMPSRAPGDVRA